MGIPARVRLYISPNTELTEVVNNKLYDFSKELPLAIFYRKELISKWSVTESSESSECHGVARLCGGR